MPVTADRIVVGTSATLIAQNTVADTGGATDEFRTRRFVAVNVDGTADIYVGPSGVATTTGVRWKMDRDFEFDLEPGEALYGVVVSGSQNVQVLGAGRLA